LFKPDSDGSPPYGLLIGGAFFFLMGLVSTFTGKLPTRFGGMSSRAKEPNEFWWGIAVCYIGGAGLIGYFFYLSN
jgi:hypothetical protein